MFDLEKYNKFKIDMEIEMKQILPKWETEQGFILDGLFDPQKYNKQKLKVLLILGEYYDHENDGMLDISWQIDEDNKHYDFWGLGKLQIRNEDSDEDKERKHKRNKKYVNTKTAKTVPALLWYLYNHYNNENNKRDNNGYLLINDDLLKSWTNKSVFDNAQECYSKCGIIEINKAGTSIEKNRQEIKRIMKGAKIFKDIIKKQIEIISPNLIILGGNGVIKAVKEEKLIDEKSIPKIRNKPLINEDKQIVIFTYHPRRWSGKKELNDLYRTIVSKIGT